MSRSPAKWAMQFVPAPFLYRLRSEYGDLGELWQRAFSEDCFTCLAKWKAAAAKALEGGRTYGTAEAMP